MCLRMHFGDVEMKNRPRLDMELRTYEGEKKADIYRERGIPLTLRKCCGESVVEKAAGGTDLQLHNCVILGL